MWLLNSCNKISIITRKIFYKNVTNCTLMHVLYVYLSQGEAGKPGVPGRDGVPGKDGIPGLPGKQVRVLVCVHARACVLCAVFIRCLSVSSWCNLLFRALLDLQARWV